MKTRSDEAIQDFVILSSFDQVQINEIFNLEVRSESVDFILGGDDDTANGVFAGEHQI